MDLKLRQSLQACHISPLTRELQPKASIFLIPFSLFTKVSYHGCHIATHSQTALSCLFPEEIFCHYAAVCRYLLPQTSSRTESFLSAPFYCVFDLTMKPAETIVGFQCV